LVFVQATEEQLAAEQFALLQLMLLQVSVQEEPQLSVHKLTQVLVQLEAQEFAQLA